MFIRILVFEMKDHLIIGLDGGASKINGWNIELDAMNNTFRTGAINCQKKYKDYPEFDLSFKPVSLQQQIGEIKGTINVTKKELDQSRAYLKACVDVIEYIKKSCNAGKVTIGIGMPGLKTSDKRGISALANGPRMPQFAARLESMLKEKNIMLQHPVYHIGSDADYCGMGEEYAGSGKFRDVANAYYLGGGTGVADALKLNGNLIPFDHVNSWMAKTWEMRSAEGTSLENAVSAQGIQFMYANLSGLDIEALKRYDLHATAILNKAISGDPNAIKTMGSLSKNLAALLYERITTLYFGWMKPYEFLQPSKTLDLIHPYTGTLLERIIIGQRLGELIDLPHSREILWDPIINRLTMLVSSHTDQAFKSHYLKHGKFDESILQTSNLREAPVIGAGADAHFNGLKLDSAYLR